jgi:hypothetical protein
VSRSVVLNDTPVGYGYQLNKGNKDKIETRLIPVSINIPPCLSAGITINENKKLDSGSNQIRLEYPQTFITGLPSGTVTVPRFLNTKTLTHSLTANANLDIPATDQQDIPTSGIYLINSSAEPYKFGWFLVRATTLEADIFA